MVTKALTLAGASADSAIINARGLAKGIYVDGVDHPGLYDLAITGLTVADAIYEGFWWRAPLT